MKFYEYGEKDNPVIIMIHGGGNSKWMFERQAKLLEDRYRVILPELDGHGEEREITYPSTIQEADQIADYIKETCNNNVLLITGASLGAQIGLEICAREGISIQNAVLESGLCTPKKNYASILSSDWMLKLMELSYRWKPLVNASCKSYGWPEECFQQIRKDAMVLTRESSRNLYKTYLNYQIPESIKTCNTRFLFWYGSRENKMMKRDVNYAANKVKNSTIEELKGFHHCGLPFTDPEAYVEKIGKFLNRNKRETGLEQIPAHTNTDK